MASPRFLLYKPKLSAAESNVETEVDVGAGIAHGNKLGSNLEELMIAADKEVEAFGMEVDHPAER